MEQKELSKYSKDVLGILTNYTGAKTYHARNINRTLKNWQFYFGLDAELGLGQYPAEVAQSMIQQKRQVATYNIAKVVVDSLAGGIMLTPFEPEFIPIGGEATSLTTALESLMRRDRELMNWQTTFLEMVIGGLVGESAMKMVVSTEYESLGNIGFEMCLPGSLITDPYWKTSNSRDMKKCWKRSWLPVQELVKTYPEAKDFVRGQLASVEYSGNSYGRNTGVTPYYGSEGTWGNAYEVIEQFDLVDVDEKVEKVMLSEGEITIPKELKDSEKGEWLDNYYPEWTAEAVYEEKNTVKKSIVRAICPQISHNTLLSSGETQIQCGALPFSVWSASRHNGQSHSIIDSIKDTCTNINYWESMITHKIQTEGSGGAQLIDPAGFANRAVADDYLQHRNVAGATFETKEGHLTEGKGSPVRLVNEGKFPSEVYASLNNLMQVMLPAISKMTPASMGRRDTGVSNTSGKLYEMMKIQSDQQAYTIHYGLRMFYNNVYESFMFAAINNYSNESIERTIYTGKNSEPIKINERVELEDGKLGIKNDIKALREMRHNIVISDKQMSVSQKRESVNNLSELLKSLPEDKIMTRSIVWSRLMEKIDQLDPEDKELLKIADERELEFAEDTINMRIAQTKAQTVQAEAVINQSETMGQAQNSPSIPENINQTQGEQPQVAPSEQVQQPQQSQAVAQ